MADWNTIMMKLGVAYYPEMYSPQEWATDLYHMLEAGITLVRVLEFAWSSFEPQEGEYAWEWVDQFLDLCGSKKMEVVMCTPTATPPAWLVKKHPDMMLELRDGSHRHFGSRRDVCVNNPHLREHADRIAHIMGKRYGKHPAVVGWQIDNELFGPEEGLPPECHCPVCHGAFREWLKSRYNSTEKLNDAWGTTFWSQRYGKWSEIDTPRSPRTVKGHVIDYSRFFSDSQVEFLKLQYDALRKAISKQQWVSHNNTAIFAHGLNHFDYSRVLDLCGWDAYRWAPGQGENNPVACAFAHDMFRSALGKPFWIFETDTDRRINHAHLGEMRARGAESILFWHWRRHRYNQEMQLAALCDHGGQPYSERVKITREFANRTETQPEPARPMPKAPAAVIFSPDNERFWMREKRKPHPYLDGVFKCYGALRQLGAATDIVQPGDSLEGYRMAVMANLRLFDDDHAQPVREFVQAGGVLFVTAQCAHMDSLGVFHKQLSQPMLDVLGVHMHDDEPGVWDLPDDSQPRLIRMGEASYECEPLGDRVDATTAEVLATFEGGLFHGHPAVLRHRFGKGHVFYVTAQCSALFEVVGRRAMEAAGIAVTDNPHPQVAVLPRLDGEGTWYINHSDEPRTVGTLTIPPRDFVLDKAQPPTPTKVTPHPRRTSDND